MNSMGKPRILFVDDEISFLEMAEMTMKDEFKVHIADTLDKCLEIVKSTDICAIISDYQMKDINGVELLRQVKELRPNIRRILLSGKLNFDIVVNSINEAEIHKVMLKPWKRQEMVTELRKQISIHNEVLEKEQEVDLLKQTIEDMTGKTTESDKLLDLLIHLSENSQVQDFSEQFLLALDGMRSLANLNLEVFFENNDETSFRHSMSYFSDMEVIANQYDQKFLTLYIHLVRAYLNLYTDDLKEAIKMYKAVQSLFTWLKSDYIDDALTNFIHQFPISLPEISYHENEPSRIQFEDLDKVKIHNNLKGLLKLDLGNLINISSTLFTYIERAGSPITYFIVIQEDLPVFELHPESSKVDIGLVSGFMVALSSFLKEMASGKGDIEKIKHDGGVILIHIINNTKYIMMTEIDEIQYRVGLRQFALQSYDLIQRIPASHMANPEEDQRLQERFYQIFGVI